MTRQHTQNPDPVQRAITTDRRHGILPRLIGGRSVRFAAGLALALPLVFGPIQAHSAFAACPSFPPVDTATGNGALAGECGGAENTADGFNALFNNTTGNSNTAVGELALQENTTGQDNTAMGRGALGSETANDNTALGANTLPLAIDSSNTALGAWAGNLVFDGADNTFVGAHADEAVQGLTNATAIGANAKVGESNALVLGNNAKVGIGTSTPGSELTVAGTIESTSGGIKFPDGTLQATAGLTSVAVGGPLSTGNGIISLGTVPIADGGTGITEGPILAGEFLRSSGTGSWSVDLLHPSDLPAGSAKYVQNSTGQQTGASFNIDGSGTLGGTLKVGPGLSDVAGALGVGTAIPHSTLQVGQPSTDYASFLQIPMVSAAAGPPAAACNSTTFVGRMVLQYDAGKVRTTLWSCSPTGLWTRLAQG
jgi:hypothetical protein